MSQHLPIAISLLSLLVVWMFGSFGPTLKQYKDSKDWEAAGGWAACVAILGMVLYFWWSVVAVPFSR